MIELKAANEPEALLCVNKPAVGLDCAAALARPMRFHSAINASFTLAI